MPMNWKTTLLSLLLALPAFAGARAELSSDALSVGRPVQLRVTTDGEAATPPAVPHIDGAETFASGQMTQMNIINGSVKRETSWIFTVVPRREGALDVPSIDVGGQRTQPLHVTVDQRGAVAPDEGEADAQPQVAEPTRAFVRLDVPDKQLFVGQAVPVKIRAYFLAGTSATLQGEPKLDSEAFTLSELSKKPSQREVELNGQRYLQATWTATLSAAKPSSGPVAIELPVEMAYRARSQARHQRRRSLRDLFGADPFFDDPFFNQATSAFGDMDELFDIGAMQRREVTLRGSAGALEVAALPTKGRPAGFTGAVGHFELQVEPPTSMPRVGEPLTLTVRATGEGNFERLGLAGVPESDVLKTYEVKQGALDDAWSGPKSFTQVLVPRRDGPLQVPPLTLTYFDPEKAQYVEAKTEPFTLQVQPSLEPVVSDAQASAPTTEHAAPATLPEGRTFSSLQPLIQRPTTWGLMAGALVLSAALGLLGRRRNNPRAAEKKQLERALTDARKEMDTAVAAHDAPAFFLSARKALQQRLGAMWMMAPEAITSADVESRLGVRGDGIRSVFERADGLEYAGTLASSEPLEPWRTRVKAELDSLEVPS